MCKTILLLLFSVTFVRAVLSIGVRADNKLANNDTNDGVVENKIRNKMGGAGMALIFVEELKILMERQVLGICPQSYKMAGKAKNNTSSSCDVEVDPQDLAGRLASLALRAHSAARSTECSRLASSLANAFSELARAAAFKQNSANNAATLAAADAGKKRKLSKSQKAKIQAKQRTALAVKKKAAAVAAKIATFDSSRI